MLELLAEPIDKKRKKNAQRFVDVVSNSGRRRFVERWKNSAKIIVVVGCIYLQVFKKLPARLETLLALVPPADAAVCSLLPVLLGLSGRKSYGGRSWEYRRQKWLRLAAPRVLLLLLHVVLVRRARLSLLRGVGVLGHGQPRQRVLATLRPQRAQDASATVRQVVVLVDVRLRQDAATLVVEGGRRVAAQNRSRHRGWRATLRVRRRFRAQSSRRFILVFTSLNTNRINCT